MMRAVRRRWSAGAVPVSRVGGLCGDAGAAGGWRRCLSSDVTPKVLRGGHSKSGKKRKFKTNRNRRYILDPASHAKEQYQEYRHPQPPSPGMAPFVEDPKKMIKLLVSAEKVRMAMLQPQDFSVLDMTKDELALNPPAPKEPLELEANDIMPGHDGHLPKQAHALTGGPQEFLGGSVVVKEPVTPLKEKQFYLDLQEVASQDKVDKAIQMLDELLAKDNVDSTTKDNALAAVVSSIVRARTIDEAAEFVENRVFRQGKYVTAAVVHALVNGLFLKRDFERAESIWHSLRCRSPFEMTTALFHLRLKQMAQVRNGYKARELIEEFEDYHLSPLLLNMLDLSVPEEFAEAFGTRGAYFQAMHACARDDENTEETFRIYERFKATGLPANPMALAMLLKACATQGDVARAKQVWKEFRRENPKVRPNLHNFNEVLNVYAQRALKLRKGSRKKIVDPNPHLRVKPVDEARELIKVLAFLPKDALFNPRWRKQLLEATLELDAIEEEARLRGLEDIGGHDDTEFQAALQKAKSRPDEEFHYIDEDENEDELEEDEDVELMPMYQGAKILDHATLLKEERALMTELEMEAAATDPSFAESFGTARDSQLQGEHELEQFLADAGLSHLMDERNKEMEQNSERASKGPKHSDELEEQLSMSGLAQEQIDEMLEASKDWPAAEREMMISSLTENIGNSENEEDSKDDKDDIDKNAPWFQEPSGNDLGFDEEDQFDAEEHFARSIQSTAHVSNAVVPGGAHIWAKANATKSSDLENTSESEQDTLPLEYSIASKDLGERSSNESDDLISDIAVSSETLPQKVEEFSDEVGWAEDDGPPLTSESYDAMIKDYTEGRIGPIISEIDEEDEPDTMMGYFDAPVEFISEEQPRNIFSEAESLFDHVFSKDDPDMQPSIATMNIMLQVYANGLRLNRLEQFFELKFDKFGVKRDRRSFSIAIAAFCHAKKATKAKELFDRAVKDLGSVKELHPDAPGYMCKVMTRAGRLQEAVDYLRILYECGHPIREKYVASLRIALEKDNKNAMRLRPEDIALVPTKPHKALGYEASSKMARNTKVDKEARRSSKRLERTLLRHLRR